MALITCVECSHQISSRAATCPQCGYPQPHADYAMVPRDWAAAIGWVGQLVFRTVLGIIVFVMVLQFALRYLGKI